MRSDVNIISLETSPKSTIYFVPSVCKATMTYV